MTTIRSIFKWTKGKRGKKDIPTQTPITDNTPMSSSQFDSLIESIDIPDPAPRLTLSRRVNTSPQPRVSHGEFCLWTGIPYQVLTDVQVIQWDYMGPVVFFVSLCGAQPQECMMTPCPHPHNPLMWSGTLTMDTSRHGPSYPYPITLMDRTGHMHTALRILNVQSAQVLEYKEQHALNQWDYWDTVQTYTILLEPIAIQKKKED